MTEQQPTVLVTGANGFVGSRLCRMFLQNGWRVAAGVRKSSDLSLLGDLDVEYRYGEITEFKTLGPVVTGVDYVVHNAGVVKAKNAETFFAVNDEGTETVCAALMRYNPQVKKVVYISSLAAAGPSVDGRPVTEDDEAHPVTIYGLSKLAGEQTALAYANRLPVVSLRPPGIYGPGDKEIFAFFQAIDRRLQPVVGDPSRKIQLIHVDDLCRAVLAALTGGSRSGEAYFVAENRAYTMKELVTLLVEAGGKRVVPFRVPGGLFKVIAFFSEHLFKLAGATPMLTREKARELLASWEISTAKAREDFGFESTIPFPTGARETFAWYRREGWL